SNYFPAPHLERNIAQRPDRLGRRRAAVTVFLHERTHFAEGRERRFGQGVPQRPVLFLPGADAILLAEPLDSNRNLAHKSGLTPRPRTSSPFGGNRRPRPPGSEWRPARRRRSSGRAAPSSPTTPSGSLPPPPPSDLARKAAARCDRAGCSGRQWAWQT